MVELINKGLFKGKMAINISSLQFRQTDLIDKIETILNRTGFPID